MIKAKVTQVWLVHQSCDTSLSSKYYVAITTSDGLNYRTKGVNSLDLVDRQLQRLKIGKCVPLSKLEACDSSGYTLLD